MLGLVLADGGGIGVASPGTDADGAKAEKSNARGNQAARAMVRDIHQTTPMARVTRGRVLGDVVLEKAQVILVETFET